MSYCKYDWPHKYIGMNVEKIFNFKLCNGTTMSVQKIRNIFLILSFTPVCPQNSLGSLVHGLYKVLKMFHRDAGPCWLLCFPLLVQVGWMAFRWWTIPDRQGKLLSMKNPSVLQFLTHSQWCAWYLLPYPIQRHFIILSCQFTFWMAHAESFLNCLKT